MQEIYIGISSTPKTLFSNKRKQLQLISISHLQYASYLHWNVVSETRVEGQVVPSQVMI